MMFSIHEIKYILNLPKKVNFLSILNCLYTTCNVSPIEKGCAEHAKLFLANPNNFGTKMFVTF